MTSTTSVPSAGASTEIGRHANKNVNLGAIMEG